jgi:peroxiredoxin
MIKRETGMIKISTRLGILAALYLLACYSAAGQTVRNFQLKDLENTSRTLSELKGKDLTLIDFWATWCKPCTKAIPELNKIYDQYKDKGIQIIGISCDGPRSISKVGPVSHALKIKYPVLKDVNSGVFNDLHLQVLPTLIMVDGNGKIIWEHEGYLPGYGNMVESAIKKNLDTGN